VLVIGDEQQRLSPARTVADSVVDLLDELLAERDVVVGVLAVSLRSPARLEERVLRQRACRRVGLEVGELPEAGLGCTRGIGEVSSGSAAHRHIKSTDSLISQVWHYTVPGRMDPSLEGRHPSLRLMRDPYAGNASWRARAGHDRSEEGLEISRTISTDKNVGQEPSSKSEELGLHQVKFLPGQ
jgi:hypothetical protein